ncbi:Oidioi.mRNA.OKI2018_I69.chr2.g5539.t1.cds [Oikopleura dioica]|uniref:Oidioi.mRNA.OKI2018_I69.chr2.g5539.t1.cds n=1 Tax=Oikopleura dioica TaxID=34765 RepID=A0ABN7T0L4_OIKDI|nr:Oidioi.mRNA.OKI2018_I69.chr2.g5539.t1.cds [Oikopleura dioica]
MECFRANSLQRSNCQQTLFRHHPRMLRPKENFQKRNCGWRSFRPIRRIFPKFDGRFEIVDEIRIQYYHVVLKARGDFILGEYSKPAKMMSWPEVEKNIYKRQGNKSHKDKDRCVIIGPKMNPTNPDAHFNVIKWSIWSNKKHLEGFRGHEGVWWAKPKGQKPYSPEESDLGAPAFCWNFEKHEWQVFGFVLQQLPRNDENFGILERIVIEFYQIREERIEMYEHNKPIWEKINQNMIGRKELRNEL